MENVIVIAAMLLLCISSSDKRILFLISISCGMLELVYMAGVDIALYYAVAAMICMMTAVFGLISIKSTSSKVLAIFLSLQAILCVVLVFDWSFSANEWLQFKLNEFNGILVFILISLGVTGSDNAIKRKCCNT